MEDLEVREIPLSRGMIAIVDAEDYERLSKYKWCVIKDNNTFYAQRHSKGEYPVRMHRDILDLVPGDGKIVDHINRNGLDNQKNNLRIVSPTLNSHNSKIKVSNTSKYRGVDLHKRTGRWRARLRTGMARKALGYFSDPISAAIAYDRAAVKHYGDNAILNFPLKRGEYVRGL